MCLVSRKRPMPADFAEKVAALSRDKLRKLYKCDYRTLLRWCDEHGEYVHKKGGNSLRPVPADWAEQCAVKSGMELRQHYKTHSDIIQRWVKETGLRPYGKSGPKLKPVPDDFAEVCPTLTQTGMCRHYKASDSTVKRWVAQTGLTPAPNVPFAKGRHRPTNTPACYHRRQNVVMMDTRKHSIHDMAADDLRRNRWIVYRCDDKGGAKPKGKFWRVGNVVCDNDELLARAAKYQTQAA